MPTGTNMLNSKPTIPAVSGEDVIRRPGRALIGWMAEAEAIAAMLGRTPTPVDDVTELRARAAQARRSVESRAAMTASAAIVDETDPRLVGVQTRQDLASSFPGLKWRAAIIDLRKVLSFQKVIAVDGLDERLARAEAADGLLDICLPPMQPMPPLGTFNDPDQRGFTVSSVNPNLRIAGAQVGTADVAPEPGKPAVRMQAVTFLIHMGTSYLQVVEYRDRYFVRDGYHRVAGLLRRGIHEVPCVFISAQSFEEVGAGSGMLTYEVLFGERPPLVADFWDDSVATDIEPPAVRKIIRITGEEFAISR